MTVSEIIESVTKICKVCGVEHLSLFGSYAAGTQTKYSDLDFVVYGVPDMDQLWQQVEDIPTLTRIDLFEYEAVENVFLKEDMDLYAEKIY